MKKLYIGLAVAVVLIVMFFLAGPFFVLKEGEMCLVLRLGRIVYSSQDAGLKFRVPFLDKPVFYPKKIQPWDGEPRQIQTKENQLIWVDATARWRIVDAFKFYQAVTSMESAYGKLDDVIDNAVRTVVSKNKITEIVRSTNDIQKIGVIEAFETGDATSDQALRELTQSDTIFETVDKGRQILSAEMLETVKSIEPEYGVEILDIVIREIAYTDDQIQKIYERMTKERNQIAQAYRSYGEGKKAEWMGRQEKEQMSIMSEARRKAEIIKGEADAKATRIYAQAYSRDPEFFAFWRSLESYKATMGGFDKTLSTDMDYFRYLYSVRGR